MSHQARLGFHPTALKANVMFVHLVPPSSTPQRVSADNPPVLWLRAVGVLLSLALGTMGCQAAAPPPEQPPSSKPVPEPKPTASASVSQKPTVREPLAEEEKRTTTEPRRRTDKMDGDNAPGVGTTVSPETPGTGHTRRQSTSRRSAEEGRSTRVDCSRLNEPAYRKKLAADGIDPDSTDCEEEDLLH